MCRRCFFGTAQTHAVCLSLLAGQTTHRMHSDMTWTATHAPETQRKKVTPEKPVNLQMRTGRSMQVSAHAHLRVNAHTRGSSGDKILEGPREQKYSEAVA